MLNEINRPADVKKLSHAQLTELARDIRAEILHTVSQNGGHLSSNLGMVELTLALNHVFGDPEDRIIYDVGHQSYAQKLLSCRRARFHTLRTQGGISGFPTMTEDETDSFTAGHASTSISAALGLCRARDLKGGTNAVVAVIGDGALTGGMSYEALNDAGQCPTRLIVVLNDNEMSISKNVGSISTHLARIRQSFLYRRFKTGARSVLIRIPLVGTFLFHMIERVRDMLKAFFIGRNVFDSMGFRYVGPVDGHNIRQLVRVLRLARDARQPVLIHAVTKKGKGYAPAEEHPDRFHGASPFRIATGEFRSPEEPSCGLIASELLAEMADQHEDICAVTAAMPTGTGLSAFADRHPNRFFDVGIAEAHAVTMSAGLAASGMKPYVALYSTFLQRAYDQISNDICINALPVTLLVDRAGLVGADGATHNGAFDLSFLRAFPNMTIAAPRDIRTLKRMIEWSYDFRAPLAIRYPKDAVDLGKTQSCDDPIVIGKSEQLFTGDVMMIAVGRMVGMALAASVLLETRGISAGVIDAMFVKPLDEEMILDTARSAKLIVTIEENAVAGGFGEAALGLIAEHGVQADALVIGIPDRYIKHAKVSEQLASCGLDAEGIADAIFRKIDDMENTMEGDREQVMLHETKTAQGG
ncbi:MAG: 1-deoxy-D-xylulose-5-phosphate synthase [Christensenellales bacterium]|jgi:1-deoxy-D-xylulose-5-phosphate synthase